MNTTLTQIRDFGPCKESWEKFLAYKGKTKADDEPFPLTDVLDACGRDDAVWVLAHLDKRAAVLFAADCGEYVLPAFEVSPHPDATRVACAAAYSAAYAAAFAAYAAYAANVAERVSAYAAYAAYAAARADPTAPIDARLRQYLEHGQAAADMPWPERKDE